MVRDIGRCRPIPSHNSLLEPIGFFTAYEDKPGFEAGDYVDADGEVHAVAGGRRALGVDLRSFYGDMPN